MPWPGSQPTSGSVTQKATTNGTFTCELDCGVNNETTTSQVTLQVSGASSASGGGGGAAGILDLLGLMLLIRQRRRPRPAQPRA